MYFNLTDCSRNIRETLAFFVLLFMPFGFRDPQRLLNYLAFQLLDVELTRPRLLQKHTVVIKLDIFVFIDTIDKKVEITDRWFGVCV